MMAFCSTFILFQNYSYANKNTSDDNYAFILPSKKIDTSLYETPYYALKEKIKPTTIYNANMPKELAGKITNQYGVRDNVLAYIEKTIPENQKLIRRAAISLAADDQKIYYGMITKSEGLKLFNHSLLVGTCISIFMKDNLFINFLRELSTIRHISKANIKHENYISHDVYGSFGMTTGLSLPEEEKLCKEGKF